jgi:regulator of nonsense transcripts 2
MRYYYDRTPETHVRTKNLLEMMMRLKNVQNLNNRLSTMVENAYYHCIPPERDARKKKDEPPMHLYIRKLIFDDLNRSTVKDVLKQLRKLPWTNEIEDFVLKCLRKVLIIAQSCI